MSISLSEHFTYKKLLRFVFPSIIMMIFTSIYSVVDGLFVSNFVGKTALAAINLIMPFIMGISALGFMIGTGGRRTKRRESHRILFSSGICHCHWRPYFIAARYHLYPGYRTHARCTR